MIDDLPLPDLPPGSSWGDVAEADELTETVTVMVPIYVRHPRYYDAEVVARIIEDVVEHGSVAESFDTALEPYPLAYDGHGEVRSATVADSDALDRLNYMLSAPEWSVSMLEDAAEIVRATGRTEIAGAEWEAH